MELFLCNSRRVGQIIHFLWDISIHEKEYTYEPNSPPLAVNRLI